MTKYIIRRLVEMALTLFIIATATFFLLEAVPGDPLTQRADRLPEQSRAALYERCKAKGLQLIATRVSDSPELEVVEL